MVIVTGTRRSGTSMWMKILIEAGLPHIGRDFPSVWGESIRDANPHGFYESALRRGIFFATNPNPKTAEYLHSADTQLHAVKVFVPGVIRSERAYLHRVVATIRHWRTYARSIEHLERTEDTWLFDHPRPGLTGIQTVVKARARRSKIPDPESWFLDNYELVRDFAVRRYPIHFCSYERLLEDPVPLLEKVLSWIGQGDPEKAASAIDMSLYRSQNRPPCASEANVSPAHAKVFDDFYDAIHSGSSISKHLLPTLNSTWSELSEAHKRTNSRFAILGDDDLEDSR